jgi:hypothetical protein
MGDSVTHSYRRPHPAWPSPAGPCPYRDAANNARASNTCRERVTGTAGDPFWGRVLKGRFASTKPARYAVVFTLLTLAFAVVAMVWYWQLRHSVFAMDDPSLINFFRDPSRSFVEEVLTNTGANRWRPIANLGWAMAEAALGTSFASWWQLNTLLLGALGATFAMLAWLVSSRLWVGVILGLLVVTSRFSQYQVSGATGMFEGLASLFLVALLASLIAFIRFGSKRWLLIAVASFALLVWTHERYQLLLVPISMFVALVPSSSLKEKVAWLVAFAAPVVLMNGLKVAVFHIPLAVGTGSAWELGFTWQGALQFTITAAADLLGVNLGDAYLAGLTFPGQSLYLQGLSLAVAVLTAFLLLAPLLLPTDSKTSSIGPRRFGLQLAFFIVLGVCLLIPIVVTIRLEQRWLVGLNVLLLLGIAWFMRERSRLPTHAGVFVMVLLLAFAAGSLDMNFEYRKAMDGVFFRGAQLAAEKDLSVLLPAWEESGATGGTIYFVEPTQDAGLGDWYNALVIANGGPTDRDIKVVANVTDVPLTERQPVILRVDPSNGLVARWP